MRQKWRRGPKTQEARRIPPMNRAPLSMVARSGGRDALYLVLTTASAGHTHGRTDHADAAEHQSRDLAAPGRHVLDSCTSTLSR